MTGSRVVGFRAFPTDGIKRVSTARSGPLGRDFMIQRTIGAGMSTGTASGVENVLFVLTDQQRADSLGCYGNDAAETPHLDDLAREGARFERAYTPTAICSPARAALLTGQRPTENGVTRNVSTPPGLHERFECYPTLLREAGYEVGLSGKWHVGDHPREFGVDGEHYPGWHQPLDHPDYNAYLDEHDLPRFDPDALREVFPGDGTEYQSGAIDPRPVEASFPYFLAERAIERLREYAATDGPFYYGVHFFGPHNPYYLPAEYFRLHDPDDVDLPESAIKETFEGKPDTHRLQSEYSGLQGLDTEDWKRIVAAYRGFVSLIDDQVGRLREALAELGVAEDTAVLFSSDHGGFVTRHKLHDKGPAMYEDIYNVPLIAAGLGRVGAVEDRFVSLLDLPPTVLDLADAPVPDTYDGRSLLDLAEGPEDWRSAITAEFHGHFVPVEQRMLRTEEYKLVLTERDTAELYDLDRDPNELVNRIGDPEYGDVAARLYRDLADRLDERDDDFLARDRTKLTRLADLGFEDR